MNYWLLFICLFASSFISKAEEEIHHLMLPVLDSSVIDESLSSDKSVYSFTFYGLNSGRESHLPYYSIDGVQGQKDLPERNKTLTLTATPGKHIFQFFVADHYEVYSDSFRV